MRLRPTGGASTTSSETVEEEGIKVTIEGMTRREATSQTYMLGRARSPIQRGSCDVEGKKDGKEKKVRARKKPFFERGKFRRSRGGLLSHFIGPAISRRGEVPGTSGF